MPIDPEASTEIMGFCRVPDAVRGVTRDVRVRWALEEIGRRYRTDLIDAMAKRSPEHLARQPFGQIPTLSDGNVELFESGSILLYLGEQDERLLPREPQARWRATNWLFAALNTIEPAVMTYTWLTFFNAGKDWAKQATPDAVDLIGKRLKRLADALGDDEWFGGRFSIADILMVTVLRTLPDDLVDSQPQLAEYVRRGEARPAFQRALADSLAQNEPEGADA